MPKYLLNTQQVKTFFQRLDEVYPDPKCELNWDSHFTLLVAIILSAQSTDKSVNKVTDTLFAAASTPEAIINLGLEKLKSFLKSINYYNNKAKSIYRLSILLHDKYNDVVPTDFDTLITLPGVGRKTANVFLNVAFKSPTIGVDTHVFRLCHRLKLCCGKTPLEIEKKLDRLIPKEYKQNAALALVLHGRYICKASRPKCDVCPLSSVCHADEKNHLSHKKGSLKT